MAWKNDKLSLIGSALLILAKRVYKIRKKLKTV